MQRVLRAFLYAAVSTPGQITDDKVSVPDQLAADRACCEKRGWRVVGEVVIPGFSRSYDSDWFSENYGHIFHTSTSQTSLCWSVTFIMSPGSFPMLFRMSLRTPMM